jgi:serine/threonine protein kinase
VYTASAQFADFRLAKLEPDAHIHVMTHVMGTFGYLVAECTASGKLPEKSDVYSFGVVLLQLITGRKPVDTRQPIRGESLVEWARPLMTVVLEDRNNVEPLVDPELGEDYDKKEIFCMIEAAAACVFHTASMHPKMSEVSQMIHLKT